MASDNQSGSKIELFDSTLTVPSDSENYSANNDTSPPPSSSSSPLVLYKPTPTTLWTVMRGAAINLILPFVNGLMLGFGELFAHEAAFRLGWSNTKVNNQSYSFLSLLALLIMLMYNLSKGLPCVSTVSIYFSGRGSSTTTSAAAATATTATTTTTSAIREERFCQSGLLCEPIFIMNLCTIWDCFVYRRQYSPVQYRIKKNISRGFSHGRR